jgi:hypothetical protein
MYNVYTMFITLFIRPAVSVARAYIYILLCYTTARGVYRDFFWRTGRRMGTLNDERLKNSLKIENADMPCFENNKSNNMCRFFLTIFLQLYILYDYTQKTSFLEAN